MKIKLTHREAEAVIEAMEKIESGEKDFMCCALDNAMGQQFIINNPSILQKKLKKFFDKKISFGTSTMSTKSTVTVKKCQDYLSTSCPHGREIRMTALALFLEACYYAV